MTAHNRHLLAEGAYKANREAAARAEREAVVKFVRREAEYRYEFDDERNEFAADLIAALAVRIEAGDHLGDHCQHCDEGCRVGPDPEYHAATSAVGYIWFAGEGCPVCRALEHLREMADEAEAGEFYHLQAEVLRIAADRIEAGQ